MNNQVNNFDQMSQLENIARVKQFMRKGSVKLLMIVSFLQAVFIMVGSAMLGGLIEPLFKTLMEFMTKYGAREGIVMPYDLSKLDATAFSSLSSSIVLSGVISAACFRYIGRTSVCYSRYSCDGFRTKQRYYQRSNVYCCGNHSGSLLLL